MNKELTVSCAQTNSLFITIQRRHCHTTFKLSTIKEVLLLLLLKGTIISIFCMIFLYNNIIFLFQFFIKEKRQFWAGNWIISICKDNYLILPAWYRKDLLQRKS